MEVKSLRDISRLVGFVNQQTRAFQFGTTADPWVIFLDQATSSFGGKKSFLLCDELM